MDYTLINNAIATCNCQKRVVVCILLDKDRKVISTESQRCRPPNGECCRLDRINTQANYNNQGCDPVHAEIRALQNMTGKPKYAYLAGHDFPCPPCEQLLKDNGVTDIHILKSIRGTGLRATKTV
jgi:deoxycytidylate deaminase